MKSFTEMFGKGQIEKIGNHHREFQLGLGPGKAKKNSDAREYHSLMFTRARRAKLLRDKKIEPIHVDINKQYNREDSKKAKELKAKITPKQYNPK